MPERPKSIEVLLHKFKKGTCTSDELVKIQKWLAQPENEKDAIEIIRNDFRQISSANEKNPELQVKGKMWLAILQKIKMLQTSGNTYKGSEMVSMSENPYRRLLRIAAIIAFPLIVFTGVGIYYMLYNNSSGLSESIEGGEVYESRAELGQKKNIKLADGSRIRLNSRSSVRFNKNFLSQANRELFLEGEAYFDVVPNGKPFIIQTSRSQVRVLGTSFNVNDFDGHSELKVAVSSGEVSVHFPNRESVLLRPGKMAIYNHEVNRSEVKEIENMEEEFGWKDNILLFKNASLEEITNKLSDWYGVQFTMENGYQPSRSNFTARFENESLKTVMEGISHAGGFSYRINEKKVWIGVNPKRTK